MMEQFIEIHWTSGSLDEARKVSRYLVQERYVACAQIIPWIESVFQWNNQLDTAQESKVVFKTMKHHYETIKKIILDNSSYEVPEITVFNIVDGNSAYLDWMRDLLMTSHADILKSTEG